METPKPIFFASAAAWRKWLEGHHDSEAVVWVGFWKKGSGRTGVSYAEAVGEALCFGWIDGLVKGVDEKRYMQRFTPRKPGSIWSAINLDKVAKLKVAGRMAKAGLAAFEGRDIRRTGLYSFENRDVKLSAAYEKRFRVHRRAWTFFSAQPPGYRRIAAFWVMSAKREETRESRLARLLSLSAAAQRLP